MSTAYSAIKSLILRYAAPLLLGGLGATLPAQATVTQSVGSTLVVAPNTPVEYRVTASVPAGGRAVINSVTNNRASILGQPTSADGSCSLDGSYYCNASGSYPLVWTPPSGLNTVVFTIAVLAPKGAQPATAQESFTTVVGTESLQLQVSASPTTYSKVGDVIAYTYTLTNTGTLPLGSFSLTDTLGTSGCSPGRTIAAGASVNCTQNYTVTQTDLNAGFIANKATATANSLYGSSPIVATKQISVAAAVKSTLQLQISANPATYGKVGDRITFTYTVTNAGNVDLSGVAITDTTSGAAVSGCGPILAAGGSVSCTETYAVTQADLGATSISRSGQVAATAPGAAGSAHVNATAKVSLSKAVAAIDFTAIPNLTPNEKSLAGALNNLCATSANQTVFSQCHNLYGLSTGQIQTALQQLTPDQVAAQGNNAVETSFTQLSNIRWRLGALHNNTGNRMLALGGLMLAVNDQAVPVGLLADAGGDNGNIANSGRLSGFINGRIQLGSNGTTSNTAGYDFSTDGVTTGIDYRFTEQLVLGGALGYANTSNDYSSSRGNMTSDTTTLSFYGSYYTLRNVYLDWIVSYGGNNYNSTRNIVYSGINTQTQGDANGNQLATSLSLGTDIVRDAWLFTPYLRVDYVAARINGYVENGGNGLALAYDGQNVYSLVSAAAARVSRAISTASGVYTPSVHLEWEHQYRADQRLITARFAEDPSASFQITTDSPGRDYFNLGAALAATWPGGRSAFITYETVLGLANVRDSMFDFGVRQEF